MKTQDLVGKNVKIIASGNPFGQLWVGREGIVTGETQQGLAVEVMIDGQRVDAFPRHVRVMD